MRKFVIVLFFLLSGLIANAQECTRKDKVSVIIEQLNVLQNVDSILLENLPTSFNDYIMIWGEPESPLYDYPSVIEHLSHSRTIDHALFVERIIDISVGATPGADHVFSLQTVAKSLVENDLRRVAIALNKKTKQENILFWSFLFGGFEERSPLDNKERIIRRLKRFNTNATDGYRFIETVSVGYDASIQFITKHE